MADRYLVLEYVDIDKHLAPHQRVWLDEIVDTIAIGHEMDGRGEVMYTIRAFDATGSCSQSEFCHHVSEESEKVAKLAAVLGKNQTTIALKEV